MTQAPPPEPPRTPGYGESNQGYGPSAGQPVGGAGAPAGYGPDDPYGTPARREDTIGVVGMIIAVIGIAAVVVSFLALKWIEGGAKFSDIHDLFSHPSPGGNGFSDVYFSWLAWALLVAVGIVALAANLPTPASPALRVLGLLIGIGAAVVTLFAIKITSHGPGLGQYLKHADPGFWVAIAGFVVAGIGAVIGPQRR